MPKPKLRARERGIPFEGTPGARNAIVDVGKVAVGHKTLIAKPKINTGVTAIWPRGAKNALPVFAGHHVLNGNGDLTGTAWIEESGTIEGPILLTNTYSLGTVRDGALRYLRANWDALELGDQDDTYGSMPVVGETWDGLLNDIFGFHVTIDHVHEALASATDAKSPAPIAEGNVGGGTGMILFDFKGGIGTSSRVVQAQLEGAPQYTVGVLAQCNFGSMRDLHVAGVPVGSYFDPPKHPPRKHSGSVVAVIATDAPLLPHHLKRLARRATLGIARVGSIAEDSSGDHFVAFSTTPLRSAERVVEPETFDALFAGVVHATEEAVINALVAGETIHKSYPAIDIARLRRYLRKHARLVEP